ncbi:DNA primase subunit pri2 [Entomophthora muscae]|uniref:DNA primase subunit pri2 n=1 Tax=Entomophthora muscae TaxID=34485 RepID=A0ACC2SE00_9FUNG|nr:DNA primase subunit pri2 [Entomophthora muscae]
MLGSKFEVVSDQEKELLRGKLDACKFLGFRAEFDNTTFLKIPFERVYSLVGSRQVYIKNGLAYVPSEYASSWIIGEFKSILETGLLDLVKSLPQLDEDERLIPVLDAATKKSFSSYDVSASQKVAGQVDAQDVPKLEVHFPLCMKNLVTVLKKEHHLKHDGRMQFGLFLKGIGLPLEQALEYWRMAFVKMNDEEFKKGYAYNIRHNYGQEGNRKNYSPYGCEKIIHSSTGGAGQHHGCPFKNFSPDRIRAEVRAQNATVTNSEVEELVGLVTAKHYNIACSKYFELTHPPSAPQSGPTALTEPITHPNQFFELSYKFSHTVPQSS